MMLPCDAPEDRLPWSMRQGHGWYVVYTHVQSEFRVAGGLNRIGYETFLPTERKWIRHARYKRQVIRPLLARYVFTAFDPRDGWWGLLETKGVAAILSSEHVPVRVPTAVVAELRTLNCAGGHDETSAIGRLEPGAPVQIVAGPLKGFAAHLAAVKTAEERAEVFVSMLGKQCRVALEFASLRPQAVAA